MQNKVCSYDEAYDIYDAYEIGWCGNCRCDPKCPIKEAMKIKRDQSVFESINQLINTVK